jgi:hypothetical protein
MVLTMAAALVVSGSAFAQQNAAPSNTGTPPAAASMTAGANDTRDAQFSFFEPPGVEPSGWLLALAGVALLIFIISRHKGRDE